MNHKVHHLAGVVIGQVVLLYYQQPAFSLDTLGVLVVASVASIAADLDKPTSYLAAHQPMRTISETLQKLGVPHRGPLHSLPFLVLLYWLFAHVIPLPDIYLWTIVLAYGSHIFLDLFNRQGVMLLYPWKFNFKVLPGVLAVSSEENSVGQTILHTVFAACFYALTLDIFLGIGSGMPGIGGVFSYLQSIARAKTSPLWEPMVAIIKNFNIGNFF